MLTVHVTGLRGEGYMCEGECEGDFSPRAIDPDQALSEAVVSIYFRFCGLKAFQKQRWEFIKENKKVRKQENKWSRKKEFFFLGRFFGRVLVFLFSWALSWSSSCFLVFFYKFPPQAPFSHIVASSDVTSIPVMTYICVVGYARCYIKNAISRRRL